MVGLDVRMFQIFNSLIVENPKVGGIRHEKVRRDVFPKLTRGDRHRIAQQGQTHGGDYWSIARDCRAKPSYEVFNACVETIRKPEGLKI